MQEMCIKVTENPRILSAGIKNHLEMQFPSNKQNFPNFRTLDSE